MALFKKKKVGKPKNPLGAALFDYDIIIKKNLKRIINSAKSKKRINTGKVKKILDHVYGEFDAITDRISKENLKIDYRSDKIRYTIIDMIDRFKTLLKKAESEEQNFDQLNYDIDKTASEIENIENIRETLKKKMKEIESDYL
jgi:predicted  nucleic acid-binding Zn-ribbon protein